MAMMLSKTYDALLAAGAPKDLTDIKSDLRLLKWMVGTNFAGTLAILFKLFLH